MTTRNELENMVLQFKVSDLQLLLSSAGQDRNGRKTELQKRALNLIYHKLSVSLEMKIRNLYRDMIAENQKHNSDYYYSAYDKYDNYFVSSGYTSQSAHCISYDNYSSRDNYFSSNYPYYDSLRKYNDFSSEYSSSQDVQEQPQPSKFNFMAFLEAGSKVPDNQKLSSICFKKLSFFNFKSDVVSVVPLIPQNKRTDTFEFTYSFTLNQQAHSLLNWSKKNEKESRYQIQLRMCLLNDSELDTNLLVEDALPLALGVKVNDKSCQLPPAIPSTNKQGLLLKRMNAPINITPQMSKKNLCNTIVVNWSCECVELYGIAIHLVEKYTSDELINRLKQKGERDPELTKEYVREKLTDDDDIAATSLKVSLICPLGKMLMTLPVRASTCNHLQCFDGSLYIKMNEVKSVWQCPICNKPCYYEDLFIDGFFAEGLRSGDYSSNVTEMQIYSDGSSEPILPRKRKNPDTELVLPKKCRILSKTTSISNLNSENLMSDYTSPCKSESIQDIEPINENYVSSLRDGDKFQPTLATFLHSTASVIVHNNNSSLINHESVNVCEDRVDTNVVLVDLTSDTESEDECLPLNLKKHIENKSEKSILGFDSVNNKPPVYELDDSS